MIQPLTCASCGCAFKAKHTGRKRHYCSDRCRDRARKSRKSAFRGTVLGVGSRWPRNAGNTSIISMNCGPDFADRPPVDPRLWHAIVEIEIIAGHDWHEAVSAHGVKSFVAVLRPRALREVSR